MLNPLQGLLLAAQTQEGLPLDVQEVLFADLLGAREVTAAEYVGEFVGNLDVVVAGVVAAL